MLRTAEYSPMIRIQEQGDTCVMILDCDGVATVIDCQGPHFVTFYTLAFQPFRISTLAAFSRVSSFFMTNHDT